ncbi:hypothetical protein [Streptomyces hirsutus]|uniref:hypothetical protein n=1 Tax=Streptomyces hirsutus TaxID=35620 RepID=UPI003329460C
MNRSYAVGARSSERGRVTRWDVSVPPAALRSSGIGTQRCPCIRAPHGGPVVDHGAERELADGARADARDAHGADRAAGVDGLTHGGGPVRLQPESLLGLVVQVRRTVAVGFRADGFDAHVGTASAGAFARLGGDVRGGAQSMVPTPTYCSVMAGRSRTRSMETPRSAPGRIGALAALRPTAHTHRRPARQRPRATGEPGGPGSRLNPRA